MSVIVIHTQAVLLSLDRAILGSATRLAPAWLRLAPGAVSVRVLTAVRWVRLTVASACSGADTILASIILLPFFLSRSIGAVRPKAVLVVLTAATAFLLNLLRIAFLFAALHVWGERFTLGVLHPVLGSVLFAVLASALVGAAARLGILPRGAPQSEDAVALPSPLRTVSGLALSALLLVGLVPVMTSSPGTLGTPVTVRSLVPVALFPRLRGLHPVVLGTFDDSSILGPGSESTAVAYSNKAGVYVLAQIWVTPSLGALASYGFDQCLLFHGDLVRATRPLVLAHGALATLYGVELPPAHVGRPGSLYLDVEWSHEIRVAGHTAYVRIALAVPPERASAWAGRPTAAPVAPPAADAFWTVPPHGHLPRRLRPMLGRLVALATRFDRQLPGGRPI